MNKTIKIDVSTPRDTYIDETAIVHPDAIIGKGTMIWNWTKVREGAVIGENCNIGQCVYIEGDSAIGDRCKIQNGVSIYRGIELEDDVFVGPHATFSNDKLPRANTVEWEVIPTKIRRGASIGSNATIVCGIIIGEYAMIGAGAVVTKDVPAFALVVGHPARIIDYVSEDGTRKHCAVVDEDK